MRTLKHLFQQNREWAAGIKAQDPEFFSKLAEQQSPQYLWIGCSDSRVPANQIVGLRPGEIFVHRNVANLVVHTDLNCLSVVQYAVEVLKVKHVIVCGHYGCGGVQAALADTKLGLIDNWLRVIKDLRVKHQNILAHGEERTRLNILCELNVIEQVKSLCNTTILRTAWDLGRELSVHGWIYNIEDGLLQDLGVCVTNPDEIEATYLQAISRKRV
ncbi:MAG: carbonate dehydratase [Oligoflexia bacterium]|nr:carbonate dehydratase [Oligoflexia bacterium]